MFEMFLLWMTLLIVLFMLVASPAPDRVRVFALVSIVATAWVLWPLYGVEYLADAKWPASTKMKGNSQVRDQNIAEKVPTDHNTPPPKGAEKEREEDPTGRLGQVGDLFGGVNALFAALAFAGVGIAAYQQSKSTRLALKQAIEAPFFHALELHHRITDGLRFDENQIFPDQALGLSKIRKQAGIPSEEDKTISVSGREVFPTVLRAIAYDEDGIAAHADLIGRYRRLQDNHNYVLGHYFRNLFQIIKLIDEDETLTQDEKQKYASLLRAQLSTDELALLMVNCTGNIVDSGEFRTLLVRYRMLEHLPIAKNNDRFEYVVRARRVVLADQASIGQFLHSTSRYRSETKYRGAFGTNPAFRVQVRG